MTTIIRLTFVAVVASLLLLTTQSSDVFGQQTTKEKAKEVVSDTQVKVDELAVRVDEDKRAQKVSAGILQPIYDLAEFFVFPAFHWLAFGLMVTGVVSFALQLVFAKLVVLSKGGFSIKEILSDAMGLAISVVGLVFTTQAAAENSSFTQSAAAVLSATIAGVILGFIFYRWGQSQEVHAVEGRRK